MRYLIINRIPLRLILSAGDNLFMAGLLTFLICFAFPVLPVALVKQIVKGGLQQQVLFRTRTGFPFIMAITA